jgi:tRNA uridine 5-carboxymethylaminomethyl modification enzyme
MFTSRAEFRLHLRIDNAHRRLTPHGRRLGLIDDRAWAEFEARQSRAAAFERLLSTTQVEVRALPAELLSRMNGDIEAVNEQTFAQFLKRPEVEIEILVPILRDRIANAGDVLAEWTAALAPTADTTGPERLPVWVRNEMKSVETEIKYAGYLDKQRRSIERMKKSEERAIPVWFDYRSVSGLSREMQETLERVRPMTLGQASRIAGVTPAAVTLVNIYIEIQGRGRRELQQQTA